MMKVVICPKCKTENRVLCIRKAYACKSCGHRWIEGDSVPPTPDKPKTPNYNIIPGSLTPTQEGLIKAGKVYPGAHVCESALHPKLMEMATRHANYQADHNTQGHQLFDQRVNELFKTMGRYTYAEIAAESWKRQENDSMLVLGNEMFRCWEQSPGHWSVASKKSLYYGADMAKGSSGVWYACILVADPNN